MSHWLTEGLDWADPCAQWEDGKFGWSVKHNQSLIHLCWETLLILHVSKTCQVVTLVIDSETLLYKNKKTVWSLCSRDSHFRYFVKDKYKILNICRNHQSFTCERNIFCFNQCAFAWAFSNQTSQAHHGRCHVHTLWTIKEVTMAAQGGQTLTNLL